MISYFSDKRVVVTGACGTVGSELVRQMIENYQVGELICLDNNESELFFLEQKFENAKNMRVYLADIRDQKKITRQLEGADIVFHTAAYKHVILCERSPFEAVRTNIIGVQNMINAALQNNVKILVFTSSDKAVNPTSVMGTSKLMGERLITAASSNSRSISTKFVSTRFGNVLGSRGSVIPIFKEQIKKGGPVTLTSDKMTRFIMSIEGAVKLVIDSSLIARGGEVLITKMPVIRISDLADVMIEELHNQYGYKKGEIRVEIIGIKPGEKMYEELMNIEETRRAVELVDYFSILPAYASTYKDIKYNYADVVSVDVVEEYNSSNSFPMEKDDLRAMLYNSKLLENDEHEFKPEKRFWPEIS